MLLITVALAWEATAEVVRDALIPMTGIGRLEEGVEEVLPRCLLVQMRPQQEEEEEEGGRAMELLHWRMVVCVVVA